MDNFSRSEMAVSTYLKITMLFAVMTGLLMAIGLAVGLFLGNPLDFMLIALVLAAAINFVS